MWMLLYLLAFNSQGLYFRRFEAFPRISLCLKFRLLSMEAFQGAVHESQNLNKSQVIVKAQRN